MGELMIKIILKEKVNILVILFSLVLMFCFN